MIPGEILPAEEPVPLNAGRPVTRLTVLNAADRPIQVGSHYHFAEANPGLEFDRAAAWGQRLAVPAGMSSRLPQAASRSKSSAVFASAKW